jgi:hypothetical protein
MRTFTVLVVSLGLTSCAGNPPARPDLLVAAGRAESCAPSGTAYLRTTLYFGLSRPSGTIAESDWQTFLREEVTPRFPEGLTVWEAYGQWRRSDGTVGRERAKVLLLVHDGGPAARVGLAAVVERYKQRFEQESVLWETARVCAAF